MADAAAGEREAPAPRPAKRRRSTTVPAGPAGDAVLHLIGEVNEVQAQRKNAHTLVNKKKKIIANKNAKINKLTQERNTFAEENIALQERLNNVTDLEQKLEDVTKKRERLKKKLDGVTKERDHLKEGIKEETQLAPLASLPEVSTWEGQEAWQVDVTFDDYLGLLKQHRDMTEEIEKQKEIAKEWTDKRRLMARDYTDLDSISKGREKKVMDLEEKIQEKIEELQAVQKKNVLEQTRLRAMRDGLKTKNTELTAQVSTLREELKHARREKNGRGKEDDEVGSKEDAREGKKVKIDDAPDVIVITPHAATPTKRHQKLKPRDGEGEGVALFGAAGGGAFSAVGGGASILGIGPPESDSSDSEEDDDLYTADSLTPKKGSCKICSILSDKTQPWGGCAASIQFSEDEGTKKGCPFRLPPASDANKMKKIEEMFRTFPQVAKGYYKDATDTAIEEARGQYDANYQRSLENQKKQ